MNFAFLIIFGTLLFVIFTFLRKWNDVFFLITFAIGAAINANIFNTYYSPIQLGPFTFGLNEFLYPLFVLTMAIRIIDYGAKDGKSMLISTLAAIILSAFIQFFSELISYYPYDGNPFTVGRDFMSVLLPLLLYIVSTLGSLIAFVIILKIHPILEQKNVNKYLMIIIYMVIANLINGFIYSGFASLYKDIHPLAENLANNFGSIIYGSLIIRTGAIGLGLLSYYCNNHIWKSENLK